MNRIMNQPATSTHETTWWSKFFVFSSVLCVIMLVAGPFGYKLELTGLGPSLVSILVAVVGAGLVVVAGLIMTIVAIKKSLHRDRNLVLVAMAISLIPILFVVPQILKARSVPAIHDISTDVDNPPQFFELASARSETDNDLVYEDEVVGAETSAIQRRAYPGVRTITSELDVASAVERAAKVLSAQGLEIANVDPAAGLVEATATTTWFGFKDDVVVRVTAKEGETLVDVRSVSRVGRSDVGANAARIEQFIAAF